MPDIKLDSGELNKPTWKDSIYRQREELARMLREPLALLAEKCLPVWSGRDGLNTVLLEGFSSIPYCTYLYAVGTDGVQLSDHVSYSGITREHHQLKRSERPYMKEAMPEWDFLLSDAYISQVEHRPSLTALQVSILESGTLGYLGADFDLRNLPVTSTLYQEPDDWRQVKGDPAIRGTLFQQTRTESSMDRHIADCAVDSGGVAYRARGVPVPDTFLEQPGHYLDHRRSAALSHPGPAGARRPGYLSIVPLAAVSR